MRLCLLCHIKELLDRYNVSDATVVVIPHPDIIDQIYEKYVIGGREVVSWEKGAFTPDELENMLFTELYEPDPVDYDMTFILEEPEYCKFKLIVATNGYESEERALETAKKIVEKYREAQLLRISL